MITLQLDMYQACALGALVYCLGRLMVNKLSFLSKYCIPAPVAGGIVFAFAHLALYAAGILELSFDTTLQSVFMTIFFCSVGFTACFRLLKKGGIQVFMFLGLAIRHLYRSGRSRQRSCSSIWIGSAPWLMYGVPCR